ncbi:MAG: class I SAM-dependent methyltransferase [Candidatus Binataceae bacterium]
MIKERAEYLLHCIHDFPNKRVTVLDVGCGAALPLLFLERDFRSRVSRYVGIDRDVKRLFARYRRVHIPHEFYEVDLNSSWDLGHFDIVYCAEVIEHLKADGALFSKLISHLSDMGTLILTTPSKRFVEQMASLVPGFDGVSVEEDGGHVRPGYDLTELKALASENGAMLVRSAGLSHVTVDEIKSERSRSTLARLVQHSRELLLGEQTTSGPAEADGYWSIAVEITKVRRGASEFQRA